MHEDDDLTEVVGRHGGWAEICQKLWPGSLSSLKRHGPELKRLGVVQVDPFGRRGDPNNPRVRRAWTLRPTFRAWVMIHGQKREGKKM